MRKKSLSLVVAAFIVLLVFLGIFYVGKKGTKNVAKTKMNFTISDIMKGFSTEKGFEEFFSFPDTTDVTDKTFVEATHNNGIPGGYTSYPKKIHKVMSIIMSAHGTKKMYADDKKGATIKEIKKALKQRDAEFKAGTLIATTDNNYTLFYCAKQFHSLAQFDKFAKQKGWKKDTKIEKIPDSGYVSGDKSKVLSAAGGTYNAEKDSNAATVVQVRKVLANR